MLTFNNFRLKLIFFLIALTFSLNGQVTGVKYLLKARTQTEQIEAYLVIVEGKATDAIQRIQFNAQFSIVVPTGLVPDIHKTYMPLNNNMDYTGTVPCKWTMMSRILSPEVTPKQDYYSFVPDLNPSSFYNNLVTGDTIHLFTLNFSGSGVCLHNIRLFDNEKDPNADIKSMKGANFINTFTLGGTEHIFKGNLKKDVTIKAELRNGSIYVDSKGKSYQWFRKGNQELIATTTEPMYRPDKKGVYFAKIISNRCEVYSDYISFKR